MANEKNKTKQDPKDADWEDLAPPQDESLLGDYRVELPVFEGPLDLLLHLIRKHEIDIFDIPISLILDKYTAYLEWMRVLNLDIAGEFLVMAATLAQIKSRMLLPPGEAQEEEQVEEGDPREELVRRLLEYQRYKEAADELRERPILYRDVFGRGDLAPQPVEEDSPFSEVSVFRLIEALDRVLARAKTKVSHQVLVERISIATRIQELTEELVRRQEMTFEELFGDSPTKALVIITFIALLEMARLKMVKLVQAEGSGTIYVRNLLDKVDPDQILASIKIEDLPK